MRNFSYVETKARQLSALGMSHEDGANIAALYGTNADRMINLKHDLLEESELPLPIKLTLHYAINYEMAMTPVDYFMRRTGTIFFDIKWVQTWKQSVINYMEQIFNWSDERKAQMTKDLELRISEATSSAPLK